MVDSLRDAPVGTVREQVLTRERILDAVTERLELTGIAGLRLKDVADRLGVSVPSLYRFFEDREAMIAAAYVRDFAQQTFVDIDAMKDVLGAAETAQAYREAIQRIVQAATGPAGGQDRWRKLAAMAATRHDPLLVEQIATIQAEYTKRVADLFAIAASRGFVDEAINPMAFAVALQGLAMGALCCEAADGDPVDVDDVARALVAVHEALVE